MRIILFFVVVLIASCTHPVPIIYSEKYIDNPPSSSKWILTNPKKMRDHWRISELRFYDDKECEIPLKVASGEYIFSSIYHALTEDPEVTLADGSCPDLHYLDWGNHWASEANPDQLLPFSTYIGYDFGEEKTLRCIWICQAPSFSQKVPKPVIKIWDSDKSDWVEVGFVQLK